MIDAGSEEFNTTGEDSMAAVELQEQRQETRSDLKDQIHGVGLEVEKVRTQMGVTETRLVDRISGVGGEVEKVRTEMGVLEVRVDEKMGEMEMRLSDQISGLQKNLRGWLVIGISVVGTLIALLAVLG